jgi:hypothetical protein
MIMAAIGTVKLAGLNASAPNGTFGIVICGIAIQMA